MTECRPQELQGIDDAQRRLQSKNRAMFAALLALAVLLFAVSLVRMREAEERRHERLTAAGALPATVAPAP